MPVFKVKTVITRIIAIGTLLFFMGTIVLPTEALAGRSAAGGGNKSSIDIGDFALAVGMSMGQFVIGGALNGAIGAGAGALGSGAFGSIPGAMGNSFIDSFSNAFSGGNLFDTAAGGFTTFAATSEVSRAVAMTAQAHNWDKQTAFIANALGTSMAAGMINPEASLGNTLGGGFADAPLNVLRGGFTGALTGLADAGLQMAVDPRSLDENRSPNALAQIAGMAGGLFAANLGRALVNPTNYTSGFISSNNMDIGKSAPDAGTIAARLTIGPVIDTLNAWPILAGRAAGILAADQVHEPWKNVARSAVSGVLAPALNSVATAYELKPSLACNIDKEVLARGTGIDMQGARDSQLKANNGSPGQSVINTITQWAKFELPAALISGGVQAGLGAMIGKDKSLAKQMLISVGSVIGTGIARGLVWYAYNQSTYGDNTTSGGKNDFAASARAVDPGTAIALSTGQALMESGAQSLSMGMSNVPEDSSIGRRQGELDSFAWSNYARNLAASSRSAASGKIGQVMTSSVVNAAMDVADRNVMTALANTPIGTMMGAQAFVPLVGYKGVPISLATVRERTAQDPAGSGPMVIAIHDQLPIRSINLYPVDVSYGGVRKDIKRSIDPGYNNNKTRTQ